MASPPSSFSPTSLSPPYPSTITLPSKKRPNPATATSTPQPSSKRRKPSIAASASSRHPLRQTSFPPEALPSSPPSTSGRTPSIDGAASSVVSRGGRRGGKRGGRAAGSVCGRKAGSTVGGRGGGEDEDGGEEEEDENEGLGEVRMEEGGRTVDDVQEKEREKILIAHFTPEQQHRWEAYRRVKPSVKVVKTIANRALSQSIPARVAIALNGMTKLFVGAVVERARDVQEQWEAAAAAATGNKVDRTHPRPLMPDHLREAMRRLRRDEEGGGAGLIVRKPGGEGGRTALGRGGKRMFR